MWIFLTCFSLFVVTAHSCSPFVKSIQTCHKNTPEFDTCMRRVLNELRPMYKEGIKEFGIPPLDPIVFEKVTTSKHFGTGSMELTVKNMTVEGWTESTVTEFKTNWDAKTIEYYQFFPEIYFDFNWEISINVDVPYTDEGRFNLLLFNFTQVTTVTWTEPLKPFTVRIEAVKVEDLQVIMADSQGEERAYENIQDFEEHTMFAADFSFMKSMVDDLLSSAFTKLFNEGFKRFPFATILLP